MENQLELTSADFFQDTLERTESFLHLSKATALQVDPETLVTVSTVITSDPQTKARKLEMLEVLGTEVTSGPALRTRQGIGYGAAGSMTDSDLYPKFLIAYAFHFFLPLRPRFVYLVETSDFRHFKFYKKYTLHELSKIYGRKKIKQFWKG